MNLDNRVTSPGSSINQTSVSQKNGHSVGSLSHYGESTPLKQISINQVIKGEVTDLRNKEVTITLADNTTVTGELSNGSMLSIGDTAAFKIKSISPVIIVEALPKSEAIIEQATIQKALESAGLPKNEKNQLVVRELVNNGMPINKQSIQTILQQSYSFKEAGIRSLVLMNKHTIPVTLENVTQFENYQHMEHSLTKGIQELSTSIPSLLQVLAEKSPANAVHSFSNQLFSILLSEKSSALQQELSISFLSPENREELVGILENFSLPQESKTSILEGSASLRETLHTLSHAMDSAFHFDSQNIESLRAEQLTEYAKNGLEPNLEQIELELSQVPKTLDAFNEPFIQNLTNVFQDMQHQNNEIGEFLTLSQRTELVNFLSDFPIDSSVAPLLLSGEITLEDTFSLLQHTIMQAKDSSIIPFFQLEPFQILLKEQIMKNWTLSPKDLEKKDSIDDLYEKMFKQTKELETFFKSTLGNTDFGSSLSGRSQDMNQNMQFMQTLNQLFSYVQIPLKLRNQTIHSELFVYTNKQNLRKHPENISILLHLDMEKLGPLDIYLSLNQNQVSSKFYLEDKAAKKLLKEHIQDLSSVLAEKGYFLTSEFLTREKNIDIVKDFMERDMPSSTLKRYTFDIRA
ncbi:MAG: flagellar hook-length control protein FliK [Acetivibrio sp.]